ncbi:hypothetical protein AX774_g8196 [Zancudomyces culisetae]|uniref:Uncharacterized protein n=1 Tax=Zancudomyces culisetae TaxID=1213189 RepID=A0A1R1PC27_ZANCU|nr:hypothetical protein AX774_g8196 [Zancudomyces culisetae]|eukprot:OMH78422.1 hypothetical protein AX774_g8196 [Zancudomyces culisetae]
MSSKWLFRRWSSTSKTKEAEEEDHTLDGIPILKAPQESYTSTDDPATEAELKAVQEIQRNIDELLVGLPKEVEDDRPKFDAKRWRGKEGVEEDTCVADNIQTACNITFRCGDGECDREMPSKWI